MPWNDKDALTPQALNSRSGTVFNVKDPDFGATGDGTTDDTTAIQAAIDAATLVKGSVFFSAGIYKITSELDGKADITLEGVGDGSIIDGSTVVSGNQGLIRFQQKDNITIKRLQFRDNGTNQNSLVVFWGCSHVVLDGITCIQAARDTNVACVRYFGTGASSSDFRCVNSFFRHCNLGVICIGVASGPFTLKQIHIAGNVFDGTNSRATNGVIKIDILCTDVAIIGNLIHGDGNANEGINVQEDCSHIVIQGNVVRSVIEQGIYVQAGQTAGDMSEVVISNNIVEAGTIGIELDPQDAGTFSNILLANNILRGNTINGIRCTATSVTGLSIIGNIILDYGAGNSKGIFLEAANADILILGNYVNTTQSGTSTESIRWTGATPTLVGNVFLGSRSTSEVFTNATFPAIAAHNIGITSVNTGTSNIATGNTEVTATHGLDFLPLSSGISVTATNDLGNAAKFWIDTITTTTFKIKVDADPGATTATFAWHVSRFD
ncbi:hypothetical protein LCGC14_1553260 [marine sediment metagenome]|uniref:Rhamnogalacturonase A/B/Epimerase-like pectate lyase domain-containing protein n=1 Tax=marine sediment metagenome TaxID=412755 RepID=A0A0F9L5U7_9ZZZZ